MNDQPGGFVEHQDGVVFMHHVERDVLEYAVALTQFTRAHRRVALGASPRATLGLVHAAKAAALVEGRSFVTPDDVRVLAPAVLAHRLILNEDAEDDGRARAKIVDEAVSRTTPRKLVRGA